MELTSRVHFWHFSAIHGNTNERKRSPKRHRFREKIRCESEMAIVNKVDNSEEVRLECMLICIFSRLNIRQDQVKVGPDIHRGLKVARRWIFEV